jgi:hypothetical protein
MKKSPPPAPPPLELFPHRWSSPPPLESSPISAGRVTRVEEVSGWRRLGRVGVARVRQAQGGDAAAVGQVLDILTGARGKLPHERGCRVARRAEPFTGRGAGHTSMADSRVASARRGAPCGSAQLRVLPASAHLSRARQRVHGASVKQQAGWGWWGGC